MIAPERSLQLVIRLAAPLVWRNDAKVARKLEEFSATEAGSALDMLAAAERTQDPTLRRLFFVHAMDEARHARQFKELARQVEPQGRRGPSEYTLIHARRQNLFRDLGLADFLAFVHLAERRGELHFRSLRDHFADRPELQALFDRIAREEKFHVRYSLRALRQLDRKGLASAKKSLVRVRLKAAWSAWRRAGRTLGDAASRLLLALTYFLVLPPFALAQRLLEPEKPGWKIPKNSTVDPRRQF